MSHESARIEPDGYGFVDFFKSFRLESIPWAIASDICLRVGRSTDGFEAGSPVDALVTPGGCPFTLLPLSDRATGLEMAFSSTFGGFCPTYSGNLFPQRRFRSASWAGRDSAQASKRREYSACSSRIAAKWDSGSPKTFSIGSSMGGRDVGDVMSFLFTDESAGLDAEGLGGHAPGGGLANEEGLEIGEAAFFGDTGETLHAVDVDGLAAGFKDA